MKPFLIFGCAYIWLINIFDYVSTSILLSKGGEELNPLMGWVMQIIGTQPAMILTKVPFLGLVLYVTIRALRKGLTKRESILLPICYSIVILSYSYCMYNFNLKSLLV